MKVPPSLPLTEQIAEIAAMCVPFSVRGRRVFRHAAHHREAARTPNVSTRTLQRMRSEQRIGYIVLRGKCRYRRSEMNACSQTAPWQKMQRH